MMVGFLLGIMAVLVAPFVWESCMPGQITAHCRVCDKKWTRWYDWSFSLGRMVHWMRSPKCRRKP